MDFLCPKIWVKLKLSTKTDLDVNMQPYIYLWGKVIFITAMKFDLM